MSVIYVLWLREVKRYLRSRAQIIGSLAQPALYLLVLGFGFGAVFQQAGQGSYLQFIAPGIVAMGVLFTSVFSGIGGRMSFSFSRNSALMDFVPRHFGYPEHDRNGPRQLVRITIGCPHFSHAMPVSGGLTGFPSASQSEMNLHFASGH